VCILVAVDGVSLKRGGPGVCHTSPTWGMGIDDLIIIVGISREIVSSGRIDSDCWVAGFLLLIIIPFDTPVLLSLLYSLDIACLVCRMSMLP
jgi:hypothetical protein